MSKSQHTPGPWHVMSDSNGWTSIEAAGGYSVIRCDEGIPGEDFGCVTEFDANLIAAAPELLAACEEGLRLAEIAVRLGVDFDKKTTEEIVEKHVSLSMIRKAIAKAKGNDQ